MSDPIKALEEFPTVPTTPLPAHEVRRRGTRMRRRRQVLSSVDGAAAVLLIAGGGYAATQFADGTQRTDDAAPRVADRTTAPSPQVFGPLSAANVMSDSDTQLPSGDSWPAGQVTAGDGQATVNICQQDSWSGLGAEQVFVGTWSTEALFLSQAVLQFPDAAAARDAAAQVKGWLADCSPSFSEGYTAGQPVAVDAVEGVSAERITAQWTYTGEEGGEAYADHEQVTAVLVTGNRLAVITQEVPTGTDGAVEALDSMVPAAAIGLLSERQTLQKDPAPDARARGE